MLFRSEYLHDLLTAEELREKIDFEKHWPFAWESYKEILTFARSAKIPVIALNIPEGKQKSSLKKRDEAAAEQIALALAKHPEKKIFVLYGELHLGQSHLPAEIRRRMNLKRKILTVHQNNTDIFWKTPLLSDGQKPEVVRLGTREFCILNSVPWVKLRAYLDWLEGGSSREMDEENLDIAGLIHHYAHRLGEALNLKLDLDHSLEIFPPDRLLSSKKKIKAQKIGRAHV